MKVKIFGAGSIGNHLAYACRSQNLDVTIFDIDDEALVRTKNKIYPSRYGLWDENIKLTNSFDSNENYDFIIIGTPPDSHIDILNNLNLDRVKAILIEKPLTFPFDSRLVDVKNINKMSKLKFFIGYNHIVSKSMEEMGKLLTNRRLGELVALDVEFREKWDGIFKAHPWLDGPSDSYLGNFKAGGGATCEHSHAINIWHHLSITSGNGKVSSVNADLVFKKDKKLNYDSISFVNLKSERGLVGRVVQDVETKPHSKNVIATCEKGLIRWICNFSGNSDRIEILEGDTYEKIDFKKERKDDFIAEIQHILNYLENSEESPIDLNYGIETMKIIDSIFISDLEKKTKKVQY
tara:strand:- start:115 stop:1164 length:1050 start_codon:yes stop_codon:yes gene_type:complete